ncbi:MAG: hypothetical protein IAG13_31455 [Deltaproteobacteria bacterium]|nr:hypothetical protein [Nannocystaceae bacterium]
MPAERRPFADGPGIRGSDGSTITDWAFQRSLGEDDPNERNRSPLARPGVVGIGTTSFGRVTLAVFGQYEWLPPASVQPDRPFDPSGLMDIDIRPHMLWPITDPASGEPSVLPLVSDEQPNRVLPADDQLTQVLAPSLRRIDLAYFADGSDDYSELQTQIWRQLGQPTNVDDLGGPEDEALYENVPVRVAVRDYRQWRPSQLWQMVWEPEIPNTRSETGRVDCEDPSDYFGATCQVGARPEDGVPDRDGNHYEARIVDEGATFCDEGVLPGDKLVLFGCGTDSECGPGRRCLRDPSTPGTTSGICISAGAYDDELDQLRQICAPFISDPCGAPRREYVITGASQTELTLGAMDIPATTFMRAECPSPAGRDNLVDPLGAKPPAPEACVDRLPVDADGQCSGDYDSLCDGFCYPTGADCDDSRLGLQECEARLTCAVPDGAEQPPGGCTADSDCDAIEAAGDGAQYVCFDSVCRTPCEGGSFNCRQALLPGPGCFAEFVRYAVATRETFVLSLNPTQQFIPDRVITDPATGACVEDPTVSNLLTSRIRLGADEAATFARIPACPNPDEAAPSDPNPCRIMTLREQDVDSRFHAFSYQGEPVEALRFSNPYGTVVLDLVSLLDLAAPSELLENGLFPSCYARFRRARIPRNYREEFAAPNVSGYAAYNDTIVVSSTPLTYPVRVVPAPESDAAFVVDAGGRGGVTGVRGQVVRITVGTGVIRGDEEFRVR